MTDEKQTSPTIDEEKLRFMYEVAVAQLRLHPTMIWTRNNFFLLTQTGLLAVVSNMLTRQLSKPLLPAYIVICLAGFFVAFIWLKVNRAGQTLQRNWREIVRGYEMELFKTENQNSEAKTDPNMPLIKSPFILSDDGRDPSISITSYLIKLSWGFLFLWIVLLGCCVLALKFYV